MRILFIDDSPERTKEFKGNAIGHNVTCAADFRQACHALEGEPFDLIYLDHDLLPEHYEKYCAKGTGTELASMIAAQSRKHQKTTVILHSLSHRGRKEMSQILTAARIQNKDAPWAWMRPIPTPTHA